MTNDTFTDELLDVASVGEMFSLSRTHIHRIADFPKPVRFGKSIRWPLSDLLAYIEKKKLEREAK